MNKLNISIQNQTIFDIKDNIPLTLDDNTHPNSNLQDSNVII
jgi:hypothetical protein